MLLLYLLSGEQKEIHCVQDTKVCSEGQSPQHGRARATDAARTSLFLFFSFFFLDFSVSHLCFCQHLSLLPAKPSLLYILPLSHVETQHEGPKSSPGKKTLLVPGAVVTPAPGSYGEE